jgi:hypothetical protein
VSSESLANLFKKAVTKFYLIIGFIAATLTILGFVASQTLVQLTQVLVGIGIVLMILSIIAILVFLNSLRKNMSPITIAKPLEVLIPENFEGINFTSVLDNASQSLVVVGDLSEHGLYHKGAVRLDWTVAESLCGKYNLGNPISDLKIAEKDKKEKNLILIGGPVVNQITHEISSFLPARVSEISLGGTTSKILVSLVSNKIYRGREYSIIEAIPSPFNKHKVIIVAFGLNREGTQMAVHALIDDLATLETKNNVDRRYPVKILKVDVSGDAPTVTQYEE